LLGRNLHPGVLGLRDVVRIVNPMARTLPGRSIGASRVALRTGETGRSATRFGSGSFISSQRSITLIVSVGASGRRSLSATTASSIITPGFDGLSLVTKRTSLMVFPFEGHRLRERWPSLWPVAYSPAVMPVQD